MPKGRNIDQFRESPALRTRRAGPCKCGVTSGVTTHPITPAGNPGYAHLAISPCEPHPTKTTVYILTQPFPVPLHTYRSS